MQSKDTQSGNALFPHVFNRKLSVFFSLFHGENDKLFQFFLIFDLVIKE